MTKLRRFAMAMGVALAAAGFAGAAQAATITLYAAGPLSLDRALATAYEKASGDTVNLWDSSTGKILARLQAEQANPHADVVMLADESAGLALQVQGVLMPYRPSAIVGRLRPGMDQPSDFVPSGADLVAIVVNPQAANGHVPHSWSDLATAAYNGQVSMPDPLLSGTCADFVLGLMQQPGVDGWGYFAKLKANGAIWPGPNEAALAPVSMGARSVLMAGVGHTTLQAKQQGNSLELILPSDGTLFIPRPIVIMKSTQQSAAAEKFVDFVLSAAGQRIVAKNLLVPAVRDVPAAPAWPNLDKATFWNVDWNRMAKERQATLTRFNATIIH